MKSKIYFFTVSLLALLLSCEKNSNAPSTGGGGDYTPDAQFAIIKITPELLEHIFVSPIVDSAVVDYSKTNLITLYYGDRLVLCNPTRQDSMLADFARSELKIIGTDPYIMLDNEYAIIDWKWANFHPLSGAFRRTVYSSPKIYDNKIAVSGYSTNFSYMNGRLANEEYYLFDTQWQNLTDLTVQWKLAEGKRTEMPEVRYINLKDIEKYGDYKESYTDYFSCDDLNSVYQSYLRDPEKFKTYSEVIDRAQTSYAETLRQMLKNNDMEKMTFLYR